MTPDWQSHLDRWTAAGLIDPAAAERISAWENQRSPSRTIGWPVYIALAFGALLLCAGMLLFVSAHWDSLAPAPRLALVVCMVAVFQVAGAWAARRFIELSMALHTAGTFALGAAIALTGQIFNLSAHWPNAMLLWAIGASAAWLWLRHWTQGAIAAVLIPAWIAGEIDMTAGKPVAVGLCGLAFTYLTAPDGPGELRRALNWIGGLFLIPSVLAIAAGYLDERPSTFFEWTAALLAPLALAVFLRKRRALWNAGAIAWAALLAGAVHLRGSLLPAYAWCALGAIGLVAWGIRESRPERINLGIAGFAITLLSFYFSSVMDKLNRSFSLILLGLIFLGGGYLLERARRRLIAQIQHKNE